MNSVATTKYGHTASDLDELYQASKLLEKHVSEISLLVRNSESLQDVYGAIAALLHQPIA